MFSKRNRRRDPAPDPAAARGPFEVLIRPDGSALVGGEDLLVPAGEPVHVAVLDALQRHAQTRGEPVRARILDATDGTTTCLSVAPDGSSEVLPDPPPAAPDDLSPPAPPSPPAPVPDLIPTAVPVPAPAPAPAPHPAPAPALAPAPAPPPLVSTPAPVAAVPVTSGSADVPGELAELVGLVGRALDAGSFERAAALAFRLREHTVRGFGAEHPHTLEALSLEAFVAHRGENHRLATTTCLELARIRFLRSDPRAREELTRAVAAWRLVDDVPFAVEHGQALLGLWTALAERHGPAPEDAALMRHVNRRIHRLGGAAGAPVTGVA